MATLECWSGVSASELRRFRAGDAVEITGELLTLRDASAGRLALSIDRGERLPVELAGKLIFTVGPSPARPGQVTGSAAPTTIGRMVPFIPALFRAGARGIIGKGELHGQIVRTFVQHGAIYFAAIGGLGAILARHIHASEIVAFPELGPEAVYRFEVRDFPVVVIIDAEGTNLHETARQAWRRI